MAIQIELLEQFCSKLDLSYEKQKEHLLHLVFSGGGTEDGDQKISMLLRLEEDGELFILETGALPPGLIEGVEDKAELFGQLLHFGWMTPFGGAEMDRDGEVRFRVEIPLEDNTLTLKQFNRILQSALSATGIIRKIVISMIGNQAESAKSAGEEMPEDDKTKLVILGVLKARATLANLESSDEEKKAAIEIIAMAKQMLPTGLVQQLLGGEETATPPASAGSGVRW
ncbi:hypothetical protein MASR1M60_05280 [Rhodocyclaceae bacterium]